MTKKELVEEWNILKKSVKNEKLDLMDLIFYWDNIMKKLYQIKKK